MKTILIVDDQPAVARLLEIVLRREGCRLHFAASGEGCLQAARRLSPDLILLDIMLPGEMNGIEAARRLKSDPATASAPILVMTAAVRRQDVQDALAAGANGFIAKPFNLVDLKSRIVTLLDSPHSQFPLC